jgi:hypothetical protein
LKEFLGFLPATPAFEDSLTEFSFAGRAKVGNNDCYLKDYKRKFPFLSTETGIY